MQLDFLEKGFSIMQDAKEKQKKRQDENNKRVLQRMQNQNDNLMNIEAVETWFQPRYVDKEKIKRMKKGK